METRYKPKPHHSSGRERRNPPPMHLLTKWTAALKEPFVGVTSGGPPVEGLFPLHATGQTTAPIRHAAEAFLASLSPEQRASALQPMDSIDWRAWSNYSGFLFRHGAMLDDLTAEQKETVYCLLEATLSPAGYQLARDSMRINETVAEICNNWEAFGETLYWVTVFGTPHDSEPWGWQIDGHHLCLNCLVLGDQVVLSPCFMGAEPVYADAGKYQGLHVFQAEEARGFAVMQALTPAQRARATIGTEIPFDTFAPCFSDNYVQAKKGVCHAEMSPEAQQRLVELVELYVGRMRPEHAAIRMDEVKQHLADTWFAWIGGHGDRDAFYYQVYSPVILIEFDHQKGLALLGEEPTRDHSHTMVRTPNGNDYGVQLLRQYHERGGKRYVAPRLERDEK